MNIKYMLYIMENEEYTKTCCECEEILSLSEFRLYIQKSKKYYAKICKKCYKIKNKNKRNSSLKRYYLKNKENINKKHKEHRDSKRIKLKEEQKKYKEENKEKIEDQEKINLENREKIKRFEKKRRKSI